MLTDKGFKRKRIADYIEELETDAKELFGQDINLDSKTPLGKLIRIIANYAAKENEELENVWNSDHVRTAEGLNLEHAGEKIGISKITEEFATASVTFSVATGTTIAKGFLVSSTSGIEFKTTASGTESGGQIIVDVIAIKAGDEGNVPANTITIIDTPTAGVNSVNNPNAATGGRDRETDQQFRERYYRSLSFGGNSSMPSIEAELLQVEGVKDAIVEENSTDTTDANGVTPHSVAPYVYGGLDNDVATAILNSKADGIRSYGSTSVTLTDSQGKSRTVGFTRPTIKDIYVKATLTKNADFPTNGADLVRTEIIKYIGGADADGAQYDGLGLNDDVIHYKVVSAAGSIKGIDDLTVELSLDNTTFTQNNIVIDNFSVGKTDNLKVVVS